MEIKDIAEKVMGWAKIELAGGFAWFGKPATPINGTSHYIWCDEWNPLLNGGDCWTVIDRMEELGYYPEIYSDIDRPCSECDGGEPSFTCYTVAFFPLKEEKGFKPGHVFSYDRTNLKAAICEAALKACDE